LAAPARPRQFLIIQRDHDGRSDIAAYRRAVEEFFFEHQYHRGEQTRAAFRRYLEEP
jgi:hypothetical protein